MKKLSFTLTICFFSFIYSSLLYAQGEWVNNQGCYCGLYPSPPVVFVSRGNGSEIERAASLEQMEYWNLYANIFTTCIGTGLGALNNGINEVNTLITSNEALSRYGIPLSSDIAGLAIIRAFGNYGSFNECQDFNPSGCGPYTETDILINAGINRGWTTDLNDYSKSLVQRAALHELGHAWGAHHIFSLPFGDSFSTMNYTSGDPGRFVTRMDANTIRAAYPDQAQSVTDVGIFPFIYGNGMYSQSYSWESTTKVSPGSALTISDFLVQNIGTEVATNVVITFYLSLDTVIENTDYLIGTVAYTSLPVDADNDLSATLTIPATVPNGVYYIGAIVTVNGSEDPISINNKFILGRSSRTEITVTASSASTPTAAGTPAATPTPTPPARCSDLFPIIDLKPNKSSFSTRDTIVVTADVSPISTLFYPFIRLITPAGQTLYYVKDRGFTSAQRAYLSRGPYILNNYISDYPVLSLSFSGLQAGSYSLEGGAVDATEFTSAGSIVYIGTIDRETLTVE